MPRSKKPRTCQCRFRARAYKPTGIPLADLPQIVLARDELEALKLCDGDDLTQEQAGRRMGVSRGTIQRLLASGRKKASQALSTGSALVFDEGMYGVGVKKSLPRGKRMH